mmetsp:Transcript_30354/g.76057  ORF Transcript_30354/g.76057 Transcript_30354/m.76057 type:complete len:265 (+) Transcript_30354:3096-3890(+)
MRSTRGGSGGDTSTCEGGGVARCVAASRLPLPNALLILKSTLSAAGTSAGTSAGVMAPASASSAAPAPFTAFFSKFPPHPFGVGVEAPFGVGVEGGEDRVVGSAKRLSANRCTSGEGGSLCAGSVRKARTCPSRCAPARLRACTMHSSGRSGPSGVESGSLKISCLCACHAPSALKLAAHSHGRDSPSLSIEARRTQSRYSTAPSSLAGRTHSTVAVRALTLTSSGGASSGSSPPSISPSSHSAVRRSTASASETSSAQREVSF